jgi:hypothetical protein
MVQEREVDRFKKNTSAREETAKAYDLEVARPTESSRARGAQAKRRLVTVNKSHLAYTKNSIKVQSQNRNQDYFENVPIKQTSSGF